MAAIMFTDMVGYTRAAQSNEALTLELLQEHRSLLRPLFSAHGGTEVKTIGDAFLVEFKSALEALLCAVEIQKALQKRNSQVPELRRLQLRVGIHVGDVIHGSGDVYGDAVNVASRIEPLAEPGGICISQQVYDNVRNKTDLRVESMGEVELRNVELPMRVYKVLPPGEEEPMAELRAPRERLAVLPFVNISPDPNDEYFADGLTEELITRLSQIVSLKVIARTSIMNYKKKEKKVSEIGRELNVGSIVEGSVRKAGNRIRVAVQLVDARSEEHLWASNYDKELDDVFVIQSDVASKVASSISSGVLSRALQKDTDDIEAYTLYIKAMQLTHESSKSNLKEAMSLLEKAISKDPGFARAYAGLSEVWGWMASEAHEEYQVVQEQALPAAMKALELDPNSAEGHTALSAVYGLLDRFDEAASEAETAVRINPNLAEAYVPIGIIYSSMGKFERGIPAFERAFELDPLNSRVAYIYSLVLQVAGKDREALAVLERMRSVNPEMPRLHCGFAEYYMRKGDFAKAQEWITKGFEVNPEEPLLGLDKALLYALTGQRKKAEEELQEVQASKNETARLYAGLFINAALGNVDEAFEILSKQAELHSWPFLIKSLPVFAEMRKDPRFAEFCLKVGLPP